MNINKLIEKKNIEFELTDLIKKYKESKSDNKKFFIDIIDKLVDELNKEYATAVSSVNLANKLDPLNVYDMGVNITMKDMISMGLILNSRKKDFELKNKEDLEIVDIDFMINAYINIMKNVNDAYDALRKQARKLLEEAKEDPINEF